MTTLLRSIFSLTALGLAVLATGTGCALAVDAPPALERVGTVTAGTLTVEGGEDAGASEATSTSAAPDGGVLEIPSIDAGGGEGGATGGNPLGS